MTLHWWMHWFWVTAQIVVTLTSPTSEQSEGRGATEPPPPPSTATSALPLTTPAVTNLPTTTTTTTATTTTTTTTIIQDQKAGPTTPIDTLARLQQSYRVAKAIGLPQNNTSSNNSSNGSLGPGYNSSEVRLPTVGGPEESNGNGTSPEPRITQPGRIPGKKEAKITWIHAFSKPPKAKYESTTAPGLASTVDDLAVMPLQAEVDRSRKTHDPNAIRRPTDQTVGNRSVEQHLVARAEVVEPHILATAASILDAGIGDSTRLGRARGTFGSQFPRDQLSREEQQQQQQQQRSKANKEESSGVKESKESGANVAEIATITGSCLAIVVLLSTVGSLGFIMYRRRYLNPPQTLNSDKCSNPDSSGYIDDSTIRDNSEEMYSLDNDSFLNSLEAMTIQNYWTDSVKHTKL